MSHKVSTSIFFITVLCCPSATSLNLPCLICGEAICSKDKRSPLNHSLWPHCCYGNPTSASLAILPHQDQERQHFVICHFVSCDTFRVSNAVLQIHAATSSITICNLLWPYTTFNRIQKSLQTITAFCPVHCVCNCERKGVCVCILCIHIGL